jgi:hypothetical protein
VKQIYFIGYPDERFNVTHETPEYVFYNPRQGNENRLSKSEQKQTWDYVAGSMIAPQFAVPVNSQSYKTFVQAMKENKMSDPNEDEEVDVELPDDEEQYGTLEDLEDLENESETDGSEEE